MNEIDQHSKELVYGFIRECQNSVHQIIADSLIYIILTYYYLSEYFETFNEEIYTRLINPKIIKKLIKSDSVSSIYGNVKISSEKHEKWVWKFKINKNIRNGIYIGISSSGSPSVCHLLL